MNKKQITIGIISLLIGTLIYLIDRPSHKTYFLYNSGINLAMNNSSSDLFGTVENNLPSFLHAFAFVLITAGILSCGKRSCCIVCLLWGITDISFEYGQKFGTVISEHLSQWFESVPYLENSKNYFLHGTFDGFDVITTILGVTLAYVVLLNTMQRREQNEETERII